MMQSRSALDALLSTAPAQSFILLSAPGAVPEPGGIAALVEAMERAGAGVGFGTTRDRDGRLNLFPASVEDLRWRLPRAAHVAVIRRDRLGAALGSAGWSDEDPERGWRLLAAACAASLVAVVEDVTGVLPAAPPGLAVWTGQPVPTDRAGPAAPPTGGGPASILLYGTVDQALVQAFDGLPDPLRSRLRVLRPADPLADLEQLASAGLVLLMHDVAFHVATGAADLLRAMDVPYAVFHDRPTGPADPALAAGVAECLAGAQGHLLHPGCSLAPSGPVLNWPPVFDPRLAAAEPDDPPDAPERVLLTDPATPRAWLVSTLLPAFEALRPAPNLLAREDLVRGLLGPGIHPLPIDLSPRQAMLRRAALGPSALLCPVPLPSEAALVPLALSARIIGAVPVLAPSPAASAAVAQGWAVGVEADAPAAWAAALTRLARPGTAAALRHALADQVEAWCGAEAAAARCAALAGWVRPVTQALVAERLARAARLPDLDAIARNRVLAAALPRPPLPLLRRIPASLSYRARHAAARISRFVR